VVARAPCESEEMTSVNEIRKTFLDYFDREGHVVVPSAPLVPRNDPTLMFTNAGMVPFKNVFTGQETRPYTTATSAQKCVRAGGKHNDLDNVGYTARHHTFFEMLGNFSFGDYFKERAIELAWGLVTKEFDLPKDRLWVTVYPTDEVARELWRKIAGIPDDRIIGLKDNLWAMGALGPCGFCSEIFYDQGDKVAGGPPGSPDEDGDRYLEFWNLVFMQFEQVDESTRVDLPHPSIDTGMGLERMTAILQGVTNNFDIDLFKALIAASVHETGVAAKGEQKTSHRVIADHLRSVSFLIADGVLPSNEGRGYVLRRIMRRAMRHAHLLGSQEPLMHRLVPALIHEMGDTYHELSRAQALITETLLLEETRFKKTLEKGLGLLSEASGTLKKDDVFSGEVAFKLYDTYGFPLDLTEDALRPRGISVDTNAFNDAMARQKAEARKAWKGSGEAATEAIWFELKEKLGATEFLGYETETAAGEIVALIKGGKEVKSLKAGDEAAIIVNQTPFYAESGGQVGDQGVIRGHKGAIFQVTDTLKKAGGLFVHLGRVEKGTFKAGETLDLEVARARRLATRANHSATHLLHEALRQVLGPHVAQKGSLVAPDRLRFDFSHQKPMSAAEIADVEARANAVVLQNAPVETRLMALDDALESGAMALFGEKYGDEVRVVSMGEEPGVGPGSRPAEGGQSKSNKAWSVELCGGTHVKRTGDIGLIKIVAEAASASGVRRIEAFTADAARDYLAEQDARLRETAAALHVRPEDVVVRVQALMDERKQLERQLAEAKKQIALGGGGKDAGPEIIEVGGKKFLKLSVAGVEMKDLKAMADDGRSKVGSGIVAIANNSADGKLGIVVAVTTDLANEVSAIELVRAGSEAAGGKGGGGRPDMAQAGGPDGSRAADALQAIETRLAG
jgi:alanyl-tRNA synthetase